MQQIREKLQKVSSTLDILKVQQSVLQEAVKEIEKSAANVEKERKLAITEAKDADDVLEKLNDKYEKPVHISRYKIVKDVYDKYLAKLDEKRQEEKTLQTDLEQAEVNTARKMVYLEHAKQHFKNAKGKLADLANSYKAFAAMVKKLATDAQKASDSGMNDEALILICELEKKCRDLPVAAEKLEDDVRKAEDEYTKAANEAQEAQETKMIKSETLTAVRKEIEGLENPQLMLDRIKGNLDEPSGA